MNSTSQPASSPTTSAGASPIPSAATPADENTAIENAKSSAAAAVAELRNQHPIFLWILEHADRAILPLEQVKREHIERAMILCRGDIDLAAERLEVSRRTLFRWLRKYRQSEASSLSSASGS